MHPRDLLVDETRQWLVRAQGDLRAASVLVDAQLLPEALFHCHETAEKALSAFLTWNRKPLADTRGLEQLRQECIEIDPTLLPALTGIERLSQYVWHYRSPEAPYQPDGVDVDDALAAAARVLAEIEDRIVPEMNAEPRISDAA